MGYKETLQSGGDLTAVEIVNLLAGLNDGTLTIPEALAIMMGDGVLRQRGEVFRMIDGYVWDNGNTQVVVDMSLKSGTLMDQLREIAYAYYKYGKTISSGATPDSNKRYLILKEVL